MDPDKGTWHCNHGDCWEPGDPREEDARAPIPPGLTSRQRRRRVALGIALIALVGLALAGAELTYRHVESVVRPRGREIAARLLARSRQDSP